MPIAPVSPGAPVYVRADLDTKILDALARKGETDRATMVRALAFGVEASAKQKVPVDTGNLKSSIYTRIGNEGASLPALVDEKRPVDRVELPQSGARDIAHVGPSVEYGMYVEFGTRRMSARAYLLPALEGIERQARKAAEDFVKP